MKRKIFTLIATAAFCLLLASCTGSKAKISDYISFKENTRYVYEGDADMLADWTVFYDYIEGGRAQKRILATNGTVGELLEISDGAFKLTGSIPYIDHTNHLADASNANLVILQEPLKKGATWTLDPDADYPVTVSITSMNKKITVPYGSFEAMEVKMIYNGEDGETTHIEYYTKDIGLIKSVTISNSGEVSSSLVDIIENTALTEDVPIFYPNEAKDGVVYRLFPLSYQTGTKSETVYTEALKSFFANEYNYTLNDDVKINKIYFGSSTALHYLYVDFSKALIDEMNKLPDKQTEEFILQCIANTLGYNFGSEEVVILIDGLLYASDKVQMEEGYYLTINLDNAEYLE